MTKIQFLQIIAQAAFPYPVKVEHYYGSCYTVRSLPDDGSGYEKCYLWVDSLKGGRVSIKFKSFGMSYAFLNLKDRLETFISNAPQSTFFTDAATKVDIYLSRISRYGCGGMVLRLQCDKMW